MMYFEIFVLRLEVKSRNILRRLYKVCWILLGNKNIVNVKKNDLVLNMNIINFCSNVLFFIIMY